MNQKSEGRTDGKVHGRIGSCLGGMLLLGVMVLMVQGMLFVGKDSIDTTVNRGSFLVKSVSGQANGVKEEKQNSLGTGQQQMKKVAYLTFDDGPSRLTSEYLKILKEEGAHATFFLIGQQIEGELVDVVRQAIDDGNEVGMHTYCHVAEEIYSSKETYCKDLEKTKVCIEEKLDVTPKFFRFPWGSANSYVQSYKKGVVEQMKKEGIEYVDWNVSGEDSVGCPSPDSILANVRKDYKKYNDPVILLHDSAACKATLSALRSVIRELKAEGYSFGVLSERENPCHFGE